jgi:hypothetical protein
MTQSLALLRSANEPTVTAEIPLGSERCLSIGINSSGRLMAAITGQGEHGVFHIIQKLRPILTEGQYVEILPALALVRYGRDVRSARFCRSAWCGGPVVITCGFCFQRRSRQKNEAPQTQKSRLTLRRGEAANPLETEG